MKHRKLWPAMYLIKKAKISLWVNTSAYVTLEPKGEWDTFQWYDETTTNSSSYCQEFMSHFGIVLPTDKRGGGWL